MPQSSFGFVDYHDRRSAALAIMSLHGIQIYGQAIKVNWAFASSQREGTSGCSNAIDNMTGKWLGSRQIRCNWGAKTPTGKEKPENADQNQIAVVLTEGSSNTGVSNISFTKL
ncbi:hypothetical protein ZIOFF_014393 [Zingiber officinale]|uniref:RRM domain-containing protein n=1 Tax=Zingiber officinale TaxID=94328 RepID=A0A8J5I0I4_ZINOF|nr:hypothetical protein ZIOFF_014393 [Zingiber officinale]